MFDTENNDADIKKVLAWQESTAHHQIYWGKRSKPLQDFKRELLTYLTVEFGHSHMIRATALRHCTAIGTHTLDRNSGYMFQITQTLRT